MLNGDNRTKRLVSQLAAEKKKGIIALCLIGVMVFMWIRVLGRKSPETTKAASIERTATLKGASNSESKISFVEFPEVKGRNDVLTRDFFASDNWGAFAGEGGNTKGTERVNVISKDRNEEVAKRIADKLKLEAIVLGENPRAFVNDKLLSVGDELLVADGVGSYECEVVGIEEDTVSIKCGGIEFTLELVQEIEVSNE